MENTSGAASAEYRVTLSPSRHELEIELTLRGPAAHGEVHLQIPTWAPGDYAFAPQARDLFDVRARCGVTGAPLRVRREGWQGFVVAEGAGVVHISYTSTAWGNFHGVEVVV